MMNSIKIRQKFLILGAIAFCSLIFLGWFTFSINEKGFSNLSQVFTNFTKVQKLQTTYIEPLFALREKNLMLVMSPNENFKQKADQSLQIALTSLSKDFKQAPLEIKQQWNKYKKLVIATRKYALKGFDEGAFMNATSAEREQFYKLIESLKTLQKKRLHESENTFIKASQSASSSTYYIIISFLLVGISSFIFDLAVIRNIVTSIEKVQTGLSQFFRYLANPKENNKNVSIELKTKDELGIMANEINQQVDVIKQDLTNNYALIEEATKTLHELKEGKFGNRLKCHVNSKELNTLKNVMNEMIGNLESKIQEEISQRSDQEKLLVQQSKLAAMGNMLGNIAHQWRQPISEINAILMEVEAISRYDKLEISYLLKNIADCYEITEYMSATISDFQNFFRPSKEKKEFSILQSCMSAVTVISASLKYHNIELIFNSKEDVEVYGYPREFSHAILNILSNSKDVLSERKIKNPKIMLNIKKGKQFTIIHIEDNAGGINLENLETVFEPYFTTKHASKGTGIGLYMTKMIIENNMQGIISVQNSKEGALFTIKIR